MQPSIIAPEDVTHTFVIDLKSFNFKINISGRNIDEIVNVINLIVGGQDEEENDSIKCSKH